MALKHAPVKQVLTRVASPMRKFPDATFNLLRNSPRIEEEAWPWYHPGLFYPVRIGELFKKQYQVLGKLGYGSRSTVWLCRDLKQHRYVTLKVCERDWAPQWRELAAYERLASFSKSASHRGSAYVRGMLDGFKLQGPVGSHQCFVHEPLAMSLGTWQGILPERRIPVHYLKMTLRALLQALDFLHREVQMVHTDIQPHNLISRPPDSAIFESFEMDEMTQPSARKRDSPSLKRPSKPVSSTSTENGNIIYQSRPLHLPACSGVPVLCDFGEAHFGRDTYLDEVQPDVYRAPEVVLEVPWSYAADVWNAGAMAWDLYFGGSHPFNGRDARSGLASIDRQLGQMVAALGAPPLALLRRCQTLTASSYFDDDGRLRGDGSLNHNHNQHESEREVEAVRSFTLMDRARDWLAARGVDEASSEGRRQRRETEGFVRLVSRMLRWMPEERASPAELLRDEWLR